jgi:histidinol-phosphate aminotransferase
VIILSHADLQEKEAQRIKAERERVFRETAAMKNLKFFPSQANFLYGVSEKKDRLMELMKEEKIVIRDYAGTDHFRVTIGTEEENNRILEVLRKFEETI